MTNDSMDEGAAGAERPKRPPPTIDLAATEVPADATTAVETEHAAPADAESPAAARKFAGLVPAASGGIAALVVAGLLWTAGLLSSPSPQAPAVAPTEIAGLQKSVGDMTARLARLEANAASRPAGVPADPALAGRIEAMEKSFGGVKTDIESLRRDLAALAARDQPAAAAASVDLAPLTERLARLEQASRTLASETAQRNALPQADDKPLRRMLLAGALDGMVRRGEPYAAALGAAKQAVPDPARLAPLDPFATTGIPDDAALGRDLLALLPKPAAMPAPESAAPAGGLVERLQAGAARLVKIERVDAGSAARDGASATLAAIAAAARRNDVAAARRDSDRLSAAERAPLQGWIATVDSRAAALAAARQFSADALAGLSKSSQ